MAVFLWYLCNGQYLLRVRRVMIGMNKIGGLNELTSLATSPDMLGAEIVVNMILSKDSLSSL